MTAAFEPVELIVAALSAMLLAVAIALPVAAGVLAVPRRMVSAPGLGIGIGLLIGTLLAGAGIVTDPGGLLPGVAVLLLAAGLLCAMAASVLMLLRREPTLTDAVLGTAGCVLIGLGEPSRTLPAMFAISPSALVVGAALVAEAVVIVALVAVLSVLGDRVPALRVGVAAGGLVAGALTLWGLLALGVGQLFDASVPAMPLEATLIMAGVALVAGTVLGAVLLRPRATASADPASPDRSRRRPPAGDGRG